MSDEKRKIKLQDVLLCALFAALTAVGAFLRIPTPLVPLTLQYLFTMLAGLLLGARLGAVSVLCYIVAGLAGLPVFAEGGGIGYVLKPSFGYIIGFLIAAWVTGRIANKTDAPSLKRLLAACFAGLLIVYGIGVLYLWLLNRLYLDKSLGLKTLFIYCFAVYVPGDALQCVLASVLVKRLLPILKRHRA
jgi:biotin transport system substrate-specific component